MRNIPRFSAKIRRPLEEETGFLRQLMLRTDIVGCSLLVVHC
jgi:hypothetical protein